MPFGRPVLGAHRSLLTFFHADFGVHPETAHLQALCCALCSTEQSTFRGGEQGEKAPREGGEEGWPAKGAKRKKGRVKTAQSKKGPICGSWPVTSAPRRGNTRFAQTELSVQTVPSFQKNGRKSVRKLFLQTLFNRVAGFWVGCLPLNEDCFPAQF